MNDGSGAAAGLMGAGIVVILVAILIPLGIYIWTALALGAVFTKAGEPVWKAWVPVVNTWTLYELGGKPGFWAKALAEKYAESNALIHFYFTSNGDVHYGVNGVDKGIIGD